MPTPPYDLNVARFHAHATFVYSKQTMQGRLPMSYTEDAAHQFAVPIHFRVSRKLFLVSTCLCRLGVLFYKPLHNTLIAKHKLSQTLYHT